MQLVDMEGVQLTGTVFDDPVFDSSLLRDDVGHARAMIEHLRFLAFDGEVELDGAGGVVGIGELLGEVQSADATGAHVPSHACSAEGEAAVRAASVSAARAHRLRRAMVASTRLGSFSPPGPVSTLRVTRSPDTPSGGAVDDEFDPGSGRNAEVSLPI